MKVFLFHTLLAFAMLVFIVGILSIIGFIFTYYPIISVLLFFSLMFSMIHGVIVWSEGNDNNVPSFLRMR